MKKKKLAVLSMALAAMMALGACASDDPKTPETPGTPGTQTPGDGGSAEGAVKIQFNVEVASMDPQIATDGTSFEFIAATTEGLYSIDADGSPILAIAESVDKSEDGLTYTFKLRDAKWSDGEPVKADDFAFAWFRALDSMTKPTPSEYAYQLFYIKNAEKFNAGEATKEEVGIEVVDDKTLKVTLEAPVAYFLSLMAFPTYFPVRQDMVEKDVNLWWADKETHVSNGPFKFES